MNFRTLFLMLFFITIHSYNLMAQEISIKIEKLKYSIDETIHVSYSIEKEIDSAVVGGTNFSVISGPNKKISPGHTEISFDFMALKIGRKKLPTISMYCKNDIIKSDNLFVEITDIEFTSDDLKLVEHKAGHTFTISLPAYISRTSGLKKISAVEYKNQLKDIYGFVIYDIKKDNNYIQESYSINSYYEQVLEDFLSDKERSKILETQYLKKDETNFIETDMTIFDKKKKKSMYYFIGIVETKKAFYRIISWTPEENKTKFKADFQNILYSLKD